MVVFLVNNKSLEIDPAKTLLEVKQQIIKEFNLSCSYIDIFYDIDKPIRILGKFNIEPGKVPRPLDKHPLHTFAFKDEINIHFLEITDYNPNVKKTLMSGGRGRGRGRGRDGGFKPQVRGSMFDHNATELDMNNEPTYNLNSNDDFPCLGK
jgi:hypothetical protein